MMKLSEEMLKLVKEVIDKRNPKLKSLLPSIQAMEPIENKDVIALCWELTQELLETGFKENNQPNRRGKILYKLTGYVNQLLKE